MSDGEEAFCISPRQDLSLNNNKLLWRYLFFFNKIKDYLRGFAGNHPLLHLFFNCFAYFEKTVEKNKELFFFEIFNIFAVEF